MNDFLMQVVLTIGISSIIFYFFSKPKKIFITDHNFGWLDIKKYPIPDDEYYSYIATDGKRVKDCCGKTYDFQGDIILSYKKEKVRFWMPYPQPPK